MIYSTKEQSILAQIRYLKQKLAELNADALQGEFPFSPAMAFEIYEESPDDAPEEQWYWKGRAPLMQSWEQDDPLSTGIEALSDAIYHTMVWCIDVERLDVINELLKEHQLPTLLEHTADNVGYLSHLAT